MAVYDYVNKFITKYPSTIAWRLKKHSQVIDDYLNPDEEIIYAFCGQKNNDWWDLFTSCVVVLTNKRILIGQKRVVWGSFYNQITPDLYNDMQVYKGLFWGKVTIDTVKEKVYISNLAKEALDEIETQISEYMLEAKKEYKKS